MESIAQVHLEYARQKEIFNAKLLRNLKAEQSRVLMGIKPDAKARTVWNRALQGIADSVDESTRDAIKALFLEVTL